MRILNHPGVFLTEIDKSLYDARAGQTAILIPGYSSEGLPGSYTGPLNITSINSFLDIYGTPETDAEKYFFYAVKNCLDEWASVITFKLPYDNKSANFVKAIGFKIEEKVLSGTDSYAGTEFNNEIFHHLKYLLPREESESEDSHRQRFLANKKFTILSHNEGVTQIPLDKVDDMSKSNDNEHWLPNAPDCDLIFTQNVNHVLKQDSTGEYNCGLFVSVMPHVGGLQYQNSADHLTKEFSFEVADDALTGGEYSATNPDILRDWSRSEIIKGKYNFLEFRALEFDGHIYKLPVLINQYNTFFEPKVKASGIIYHFSNYNTLNWVNKGNDAVYQQIVGEAHGYTAGELGKIETVINNPIDFISFFNDLLDQNANSSPFLFRNQELAGGTPLTRAATPLIPSETFKYGIPKWFGGIEGVTTEFLRTFEETSDVMASLVPFFTPDGSGRLQKRSFTDITVIVGKTSVNPHEATKLNIELLESWSGSLNPAAQNTVTRESAYIIDIINNRSKYIGALYKTPETGQELTGIATVVLKDPNEPVVPNNVNVKYPLLSWTKTEAQKLIDGSRIRQALDDCFYKLSDIDAVTVDILLDAGVTTIARALGNNTAEYHGDEYKQIESRTDIQTWRSVAGDMDRFSRVTRKDCMTILDGPKDLVIKHKGKVAEKAADFDRNIGNKLSFLQGINSSYSALYINWMQIMDFFTNRPLWLPPSCFAGGIYTRTVVMANIWDAPAGLNRGVLYGVNDLSFTPNFNQSNNIYTRNINYAKMWPVEGPILEGQRTTQPEPTAFDRVNVRRLFLYIERMVYRNARYFVYEPNNAYTRSRLLDLLIPFFERIKTQQGIYDYRLVCDETNNTPDVIDNNELKLSVLCKPTKTVEFLLVNVYALRTGGSFDEIIL